MAFPRVALLLVLLSTTACQTWRVEPGVTPKEFVSDQNPERIQVQRTDNTTVVMFRPSIIGDSLRGLPTELAIRPLTVPLSEVRAVAVRRFHLGKTLLAGLGIIGGIFVYDRLMSLNEGGF